MRIAIVGGGVAGITAAYLIQRDHQVSLYEKNDYVGGHTHTITIPDGPDAGTPVDTGFIVFNDRTYPILNRFFRSLAFPSAKATCPSAISMRKAAFSMPAVISTASSPSAATSYPRLLVHAG
jgi:predicted NAD/FAD-binding protein